MHLGILFSNAPEMTAKSHTYKDELLQPVCCQYAMQGALGRHSAALQIALGTDLYRLSDALSQLAFAVADKHH